MCRCGWVCVGIAGKSQRDIHLAFVMDSGLLSHKMDLLSFLGAQDDTARQASGASQVGGAEST